MVAESIFCVGMVTAAGWDLARRRIPNMLNVAILAAGLAARLAFGGWSSLGYGLAGAGVGLALLIVLFHFRWLGGGDVKFLAAAGAWLGPLDVGWAALFGLAGGGLIALAILLRGGAALRAEVATNLKTAALVGASPYAPRRPKSQLVPMALPLAVAAIGVLVFRGGFHA
jgi:prepilin peptidase CpaA